MNRTKNILLFVFMLVLWIPFLQGLFNFFPETYLKGAFTEPEKPEFVVDSFLSGAFQKKWEAYEDYNYGFRAFLIKFKNTTEYLLFKRSASEDIMTGKNGYLYSYGSAERSMRGRWYNGAERNKLTIERIKYLKEGIEKKGGRLLVLVIPSKEYILPEILPERYNSEATAQRDMNDFVKGFEQANIPFIDLGAYFRGIKATTKYPLFTRSGFHWSMYGASLAQDSLLKYIQHYFPHKMPSYTYSGVEESDTARFADADFEEPMNLLYSLQQPPYYYSKIEIDSATLTRPKPKVIIIGDSFFWQIKTLKTIHALFAEGSSFWYYFKTSFPTADVNGTDISKIDVMTELESADFVVLAASPGTLGDFPFGVTDHYFDNKDKPRAIREEKITLKAHNGKFVCADASRNNIIVADRDSAAAWETFTLIHFPDNKCAIRAFSGKYLSAELAQGGEITASRDKVADREIFYIENAYKGNVTFKSANGKYLFLDKISLQIFATGNKNGTDEIFEMIRE